MSNRLKHIKVISLNQDDVTAKKYEPKYVNTLANSVPSVFQKLNPLSSFLAFFTLLKSISIRATEYTDKYLTLNNDSFDNKIIR